MQSKSKYDLKGLKWMHIFEIVWAYAKFGVTLFWSVSFLDKKAAGYGLMTSILASQGT